MSSHACGGDCCRSFFLNRDPKSVGDGYITTKAREAAGVELTEHERDLIFIAEMVIRIDEGDEAFPRYTCRHFNEEAGRCLAYDSRPAMCRDYPNYGRPDACWSCGFSDPSTCQLSPAASK